MNTKTHSLAWDILLVGALSALLSLFMPLGVLLPLLAAALDLRSGRWSATLVMGAVSLAMGGYVYGPLGMIVAILTVIVAVGTILMYRRGLSQMDGLLYAVVGTEVLALAAAALAMKLYGNLSDALLTELLEAMEASPDQFRQPLALYAVLFREGVGTDVNAFYQQVEAYSRWDFEKLVEAATPLLSQTVSQLIPTAIFVLALVCGGGTWLVSGYALKAAHRSRGVEKPEPPMAEDALPVDFSRWMLPRGVAMVIMLAYVVSMLVPSMASAFALILCQIVQVGAQLVLSIQGAALVVFFLSRRKVRLYARWIWVVVLASCFPTALFFAGAFDAAFRVREMILQQQAVVEEILRRQMEEKAKREAAMAEKGETPQEPEGEEEQVQEDPIISSPYAHKDDIPSGEEDPSDDERKE